MLELTKEVQCKQRGLLFVSYAVKALPREGLSMFRENTDFDLVGRTYDMLKEAISTVELKDQALEGLAVVWLSYPELFR